MSKEIAAPVASAGPLAAFGPELAQLVVVTMWASTFVVTKSAFAEISPLAFVFVRFALMLLLAFGVLAAGRRKQDWAIKKQDIPRFLLAGLAGYTIYQLGFVLGLDNTSPFSSSLLIAMMPFFTMIILALRGEHVARQSWLGLLVGIVGVVVFLLDKQDSPGSLLGDALSLMAAVSFAFYGVINRPLVHDYRPPTYTAYALLAGSVPLLLISTPAAFEQNWQAISFWGWVAIIYMVVLPVYVAYMLWNWAIARRGAAAATSFSLLNPIIAGILSIIFIGEGFNLSKILGAALVLVGLVLSRRKPKEVAPG